MVHLLDNFAEFGCTRVEDLAAVSTWRDDEILLFLNQVSECGSGEYQMTDMDKLVLQHHLLSYFNKT
jgi:hypothetical protein